MALALEPAPGPLLVDGLAALAAHPELRVPPPENLHVTLAFLGEIDGRQVELAAHAVRTAVVGFEPWTLGWGKAGAFPSPARPSVLWLGLADETETRALQSRLAKELGGRGLALPERGFQPHLTLARVRRGASIGARDALWAELARIELPPRAAVQGLVLYESRAGHGAPEYVQLATVYLDGHNALR